MNEQLKRLEALTEMQLVSVLEYIDLDPAPISVKNMLVNKVNEILNDRLGIRAGMAAWYEENYG